MSDRVYLPPDYSAENEHPREDDDFVDLQEIEDEDEAIVEKLLDEEALKNTKNKRMDNNNLFGSSQPSFGSSWNGNSQSGKHPWETSKTSSVSNSWGSWSSSGNTWGNSNNSSSNTGSNFWGNTTQQNNNPGNNIGLSKNKKIIICDVLDCLYESYSSGGVPNILPRGIFDLSPKFNVWDRIAAFNPYKLYLIFPAPEIIPSFGNQQSSEVTLEYISQCITTYLRIPRANCFALKQMRNETPKEYQLGSVVKDWENVEDIVYIGVHSGRYGLSSRDIDAAHKCGIDYIDLFNLLNGRLEYE